MRRLDLSKDEEILFIDSLLINMDEYIVKVNGNIIPLTKKEIEILYLMASHPNRIYSREMLLNIIWGDNYYGDIRTVDTHIKRMRAKLNLNNNDYSWDIKTVWGVGYKFEKEVK
jgi:two-component system response regulator ResD